MWTLSFATCSVFDFILLLLFYDNWITWPDQYLIMLCDPCTDYEPHCMADNSKLYKQSSHSNACFDFFPLIDQLPFLKPSVFSCSPSDYVNSPGCIWTYSSVSVYSTSSVLLKWSAVFYWHLVLLTVHNPKNPDSKKKKKKMQFSTHETRTNDYICCT